MWIRMLNSADAVLYRMLRLEALQNNPEAFLETYENASRKSIDDTAQKLQPAETHFTLGAFLQEDELVGAVTFLREREAKVRHKGHVVAMYVRPQARGVR
ncbi:GNAT family N-acetyltransferase [Alicyclobacillus pomorum]|jgi:hypothetical protein|uniref:GNAT family N-acetyltransferase n=1 Tax=Alicyclobacillus pomorum TaxID=204470 RepID=UPI0004049EE3|nr:GNAT family N-acetyltransferase [Alicyclobacillus pomorum]